jgi:hypothetical protein
MKEFIHIIHTDFTRNVNKTHDWWEYRLKILENFTIQSLLNQTNKDFYFVMYLKKCFPDDLVPKLKEILEKTGLRYSIIYYDKEGDLENRIKTDFGEAKYIYATVIGSEDLLHKDVVEEIQKYEFSWRRALIYQSGYCYDCVNNKMRHHFMNCPPFLTIMYPYETYIDFDKSIEYKNSPGGHDTIIRNMNPVILSDDKYIVLIHGQNNRSGYIDKDEYIFRKIQETEFESILKNFNITPNTYLEKIK